jgi:23S rRNA (guanosine2251-2'-O)-methyltransferase
MAGNSARKGAVRNPGSKKGAVVGSGGQRRKGLQPKGPTPKATEREGHPAARRQRAAQREADRSTGRSRQTGDTIAGRNAVHEALQAGIPATALYILDAIEADDRIRASLAIARKAGMPIKVGTRLELDRAAGTSHHQGIALVAAPFDYLGADDLPPARDGGLLVALDHITDPQNFGAIVRSCAAFGADAVIVPQRRSAPVTAGAWKASSGALARTAVARVGNLVSVLGDLQRRGYFVIGLDGAGSMGIGELSDALVTGPLVIVVGSEGGGLARLTAQTCDLVVRIPMPGEMESLNASVATGVALYEIARRR